MLRRAFGVARSLLVYYGQPWKRRRMRRFYSQFVGSESLCFDIGAHAGNRIRCWRELGAAVVAVEPQEDFVALLERFYGDDDAVEIEVLFTNAERQDYLGDTWTHLNDSAA